MEEARWYVVHTRTGYENKVKTDLEKTVENRSMEGLIQEIKIPTEEVVEIKDNKKKTVQRKIYPCYIMVKMVMNSETWYVVRNATGVTGFVGPGSDPVPLTDEEVALMGVDHVTINLDVEVGDQVQITNGPFEDFTGTIISIDPEAQTVKVQIDAAHRIAPPELNFFEVKKLD